LSAHGQQLSSIGPSRPSAAIDCRARNGRAANNVARKERPSLAPRSPTGAGGRRGIRAAAESSPGRSPPPRAPTSRVASADVSRLRRSSPTSARPSPSRAPPRCRHRRATGGRGAGTAPGWRPASRTVARSTGPGLSTSRWRLRPLIFLPPSKPPPTPVVSTDPCRARLLPHGRAGATPGATAAQAREDGVEDHAVAVDPWPIARRGRRQVRLERCPRRSGQTGRVALPFPPPSRAAAQARCRYSDRFSIPDRGGTLTRR
jgi:hypothetical protein